MRSPCAYLRASRGVLARRDEESSTPACARADRLLLDPADRADVRRRGRSRRSPRSCGRGRRSRPSSSSTSSAKASPADGPPTSPASIETRTGSRIAPAWSRMIADDRRASSLSGAATVVSATTFSAVPPRRTVKRTVSPTGSPGIIARDVRRRAGPACRRSRRSRPSGWSFPAAGRPARSSRRARRSASSSPSWPSARSATAAATCCDVFISGRSTVRRCEAR